MHVIELAPKLLQQARLFNNKAPQAVAGYKRPSCAVVSTALPLDRIGNRNIKGHANPRPWGIVKSTGLRQTGMPRTAKPSAYCAAWPGSDTLAPSGERQAVSNKPFTVIQPQAAGRSPDGNSHSPTIPHNAEQVQLLTR